MRRETVQVAKSKPAAASKTKQAAPTELPAEAVPVFELLRAWRAATAKEQGLPAYIIFHDSTLRQIATDAPTTLAELGKVSGVGENKLAKYGQQILDTLSA
jgi:ATP-dependent DNA helicase RecQ